jgi:hypothetical protein
MDDFSWAYLAAQAKLGRVDFRGIIVTRDSHTDHPHKLEYGQAIQQGAN